MARPVSPMADSDTFKGGRETRHALHDRRELHQEPKRHHFERTRRIRRPPHPVRPLDRPGLAGPDLRRRRNLEVSDADPAARGDDSVAGQVSPGLLYTTAVFDILGGLGVLLPSATRIKPGLTVVAALGCVALQASAIVFHFSRGEAANTPFNFLLVALSLFVAWRRRSRAPVDPPESW